MVASRGTTNRNDRGSSYDRARRRVWLVDTFGDGTFVACRRCWTTLTVDTVTSERVIPGCKGGRYTRDNIIPFCGPCNSSTGGKLGNERKLRVVKGSKRDTDYHDGAESIVRPKQVVGKNARAG